MSIFSIFKKFKQHSINMINIKNYTAHPHDLVHIPGKFRVDTSMHFWVTVRKLNVTDGQTDRWTDRRMRGCCNISRPGPLARQEIIRGYKMLFGWKCSCSGVWRVSNFNSRVPLGEYLCKILYLVEYTEFMLSGSTADLHSVI